IGRGLSYMIWEDPEPGGGAAWPLVDRVERRRAVRCQRTGGLSLGMMPTSPPGRAPNDHTSPAAELFIVAPRLFLHGGPVVKNIPLVPLGLRSSTTASHAPALAAGILLAAALGCAGVKSNGMSGSGGTSGRGGSSGSTPIVREVCNGPCPDFSVG